jgi:hypothetical protein
MQTFDQDETDDGDVVFRDLIMLTLSGFMVIAVLMLPHIAPTSAKTADVASTPPGNVVVEVNWPPELDTDIDLWVQGPGDIPVGYSNKGGVLFNLLRDDLGHEIDVSGLNSEVAYSRGIMPGEYVVNVHMYRNRSNTQTIPVRAVVSVKKDAQASSRQILVSDIKLNREGEELTVYRFRLDNHGQLVSGSVDNLQTPLRSGIKS